MRRGGYQSGGHTFPVLVRWPSFRSVFPGAFPACNPARSATPAHLQGSRSQLFGKPLHVLAVDPRASPGLEEESEHGECCYSLERLGLHLPVSEGTPGLLRPVPGAPKALIAPDRLSTDPLPSDSSCPEVGILQYVWQIVPKASLWSLMVSHLPWGRVFKKQTSFLLIVVYPTEFPCANSNAAKVIVGNHLAPGLCIQHAKTHRSHLAGMPAAAKGTETLYPPLPACSDSSASLFFTCGAVHLRAY